MGRAPARPAPVWRRWFVASAPGALGANLTPFPRPRPAATLVRDGIYAEVRHPIYGGFILLALGWALLTANTLRLVCAGALIALFSAKARREEAWLNERFPDYAAYADEVPRFLPNPW
jgi:protein-S-isoprenylcysteine O-methyltransferase Ste14